MKRLIVSLFLLTFFLPQAWADAEAEIENPEVVLHTNKGDIRIRLFRDKAPISTANFLKYVESGHYDGTVFHRVISSFMIQGGGFTQELEQKPTMDPIQNEANNGLSNKRGTIAMARTMAPHSATSQFFINVVDNDRLDYRGPASGRTWGYAVFGEVISGMEVVDDIRYIETGSGGPFRSDVPQEAAIIEKAEVIKGDASS